jgi:hypothetical protein
MVEDQLATSKQHGGIPTEDSHSEVISMHAARRYFIFLAVQKLSLLALGSFLIVAPFTLFLVVLAVASFRNQTPLILPVWLQAVPVSGAILAIVSLVLIRKSEGILAGRRLAIAVLWDCTLMCLAYWAYYSATYLAIRQQSDDFVQKWIQKIATGKPIVSFLDTLPPNDRRGIDPDKTEAIEIRFGLSGATPVQRSSLDTFRENELVRLANGSGAGIRVSPLGVRKWQYDKGVYKVIRSYQVAVPEATITADIETDGSVSQTNEFSGRQWELKLPAAESITGMEITERGRNLRALVQEAARVVDEWWKYLGRRDFLNAYLTTKDMAARPRLRAEYLSYLLMSGMSAGTAPAIAMPGVCMARWMPALNDRLACSLLPEFYEDFSRARIFDTRLLRADDQQMTDIILGNVRYLTGSTSESQFSVPDPMTGKLSSRQRWKIADGKITLPIDALIGFGRAGLSVSGIGTHALVFLEGPDRLDAPGPADLSEWRITGVELLRGVNLARMAQRARPRRWRIIPATGWVIP